MTVSSTNSRHHFITISVCTSAGIRFVIGSSLFQRRPTGPVSSPECDVGSLWWCNSSASSCFSNWLFKCDQLLPSAEINTLKCVCSPLCFASCVLCLDDSCCYYFTSFAAVSAEEMKCTDRPVLLSPVLLQ